uniref:RING-type domain-containing protein n=1 Tax=Chrysemys picta bellii TaxID=8478 RepID=A0A8C3G084_CHRPI
MRPPLPLPLRAFAVLLLADVAVAEAFGHVVYDHGSTCVGYNALPACFGPPLPSEGLMGYLIEAMPANACDPIERPPASSNSSEAFIALIRRSDCPFGVKVLHAQQAGYQAAVVHNVNAEHLVNMVTDDKEIRQRIAIHSVFTGESAYMHLRRASRYEKGAYVTLVAPKQPHNPCQDFGFMINVIICTIPRRRKRRNPLREEQGKESSTSTFKRGAKYTECAICLEMYEKGDMLKILSCSHAYHGKCIDLWLLTQTRNKTCPLCMQRVTVAAESPDLDIEECIEEERDEGNQEGEEDGHNREGRFQVPLFSFLGDVNTLAPSFSQPQGSPLFKCRPQTSTVRTTLFPFKILHTRSAQGSIHSSNLPPAVASAN